MLTNLVAAITLLFAIFALATMVALPVAMLVSWLRRPGLLRSLWSAFQAPQMAVATPTPSRHGKMPFALPPLPQRRLRGGWEQRLDGLLTQAVQAPPSTWWWTGWRWLLYAVAVYALFLSPLSGDQVSVQLWLGMALAFCVGIALLKPGFKRKLALLTLYFGRIFPYALRPWYWLSAYMRGRLANVRFVTVRTLFLRRLFSLEWSDGVFRPAYAIGNWITFLIFLFYLPLFIGNGIEAGYAWGTYPFGTYQRLTVTQAYRKPTDQNTFAVHAYTMMDGEKREYYFELGPNIWFWQLYPEYLFGKITQYGGCTFDTYGWTVRIPNRLKLFTAGSLYALNPWIVDVYTIDDQGRTIPGCTQPTIVPAK